MVTKGLNSPIKYISILIIFFLITLACSFGDSLLRTGEETNIVGLWHSQEGGFLEVTDQDDVYYTGSYGTYNQVENKFVFPDLEYVEYEYKLINYSNNKLTLERNDKVYEFSRIDPNENLKQEILGAWENESGPEGYIFTKNHVLFLGELLKYEVHGTNALIFYPDNQNSEVHVVRIEDDLLSVDYYSIIVNYKKIEKCPGLEDKVVGKWMAEDYETIVEFSSEGEYRRYYDENDTYPEIYNYEVSGDSGILIKDTSNNSIDWEYYLCIEIKGDRFRFTDSSEVVTLRKLK